MSEDKKPEPVAENEATTAALEAKYEDIDRSFSDGVQIEPEVEKKTTTSKTTITKDTSK